MNTARKTAMPVLCLLGAVVIVAGFGIGMTLLSLLQPKFIGDASVYKYKVVISSIWFDHLEVVTAENSVKVKEDRRVYYTNEYSVLETGRLDKPVYFAFSKNAQFEKDEDGNYSLVVSGYGFTTSPDQTLDVTVIEQSSKRVVYNSTNEFSPHQGL